MLMVRQNPVFWTDDEGDDVPRPATERRNPGDDGETQRAECQRHERRTVPSWPSLPN